MTLAARLAVPAVYPNRDYAIAGGLASFGPDFADTYRQAGNYTARILKGTRPEELPVMQPSKFQMVVNLRTAQALGIVISQAVEVRADKFNK